MTMKLKVRRFRTRRPDPAKVEAAPIAEVVTPTPRAPTPRAPMRVTKAQLVPTRPAANDMPFADADDGFGDQSFVRPGAVGRHVPDELVADPDTGTEIDMIRREGLTGRQLRMARRIAEKEGLPATSDFDAVRLLRRAGIDPFQKSAVLELVAADANPASRALTTVPGQGGGMKLPATVKPMALPSTEVRVEQSHAADIHRIQLDITRRRRRKVVLLVARLFFFVGLPTLMAAWYYFFVATPMYATHSQFVIQQSEPKAAGFGGLLAGTQFATSQDSVAVQGYLQSRDAMLRLDKDQGFIAHFSSPDIDVIQRLPEGATEDEAYRLYQRMVHISYDPSEGFVRMEVLATDPQTSAAFSRALIGYAEEQVDGLTQRLREDQMRGAAESQADAEQKMLDAQHRVVELQEKFKVLSSEVEVSLITTQITQLETQLNTDRLSLAQMEANRVPNVARMEPVKRRIATLEKQIADLRAQLTEDSADGTSLAQVQSELLVAQADVQTRQLMLAQSLQQMEAARIEANRQVRYLSVFVSPVPPDEPTYPRAFESTLVALLIFAGIYLMISMTVAILREQVTA